ncbi:MULTISPECIES: sialate O-acetylesterase [unclassified Polaribacter]|uniref:sialate O-acetylesterase n=1 Tax=unclassified Polaribacter TaxID=196858 RepID=UPI0011BDABF4|nr:MULTISPECIES: sialate O-acetylesterase [unclassified Polaribacter]TXD50503.1 sialate O-acetylesterase [Polaribacter sp. IC063]TXD61033.1 sialate O-acetylesterase [Polaribacter sp. IC066]
MKKHKLITFLILAICAIQISAQTKLSKIFGSDMVLQQNQEVSIWGTDSKGTKIKVSGEWGAEEETITKEDGKWKLKIQTPKAGGPYKVSINGSEKIILKNVLIGEVWFCSGQSNMAMKMKGGHDQPITGNNEAILNSKNSKIRLFTVKENFSTTPLNDIKGGQWKEANPLAVSEFSATAYFYGKLLQMNLDVPVGLIVSSRGSSPVEAWMDKKTLSQFNDIDIPTEMPNSVPQKAPLLLYNAMTYPLLGFNIKGFIWYQGESNTKNAHQYKERFTTLINTWRKQWNLGKLPFYFVQIAPYEWHKPNSALLREAQMQVMQTVENTGMATILDTDWCKGIHPPNKRIAGERLAYWALAKTYNIKGFSFSGPIYKSMEVKEDKIEIAFDYAENGLTNFKKKVTDFEICGEDKVFYPAKIKFGRKNKITVWSNKIKKPIAVRYGFKNCTNASLYNTAGIPASSFRTDSWEIENK